MNRAILVTFFLITVSSGVAAQVRAVRDLESANILKIAFTETDPKLKIEPVTGDPDKTSLVKNQARTLKAFVLCVPAAATDGGCSSRVFVTDIKTGKTSVIKGEPPEVEVMRPIDALKWLDNDRISYERWMNPHFGHRYVINVRTRKQVGAWILRDE